MGLFGWFDERKRRKAEEEQAWYEEQERLQREQDRQRSASSGPPDDVIIKTDVGFGLSNYIYKVRITNDSQDPMGDINVTVLADNKVGIPLEKTQTVEMLDPDETVVLEFKIVPVLNMGKGVIRGQMTYFNFSEQEKVTFKLKSRSVQVSCPRMQPMKVDDDLWRIRMTNLDKFEYESEEVHAVPSDLFDDLCLSAEHIGFFGTDPFVVPTLYRGIRKFMGTVGEDVYAAQVQVIGQEDVSKILMECFGPSTEKAMGVAARMITPLDDQYHLKKHIKSDLDPQELKGMVETADSGEFDDSEVKVLGKDKKPLAKDKQVVRKKRAVKEDSRPQPGWTKPEEEEQVEVWETQQTDTTPAAGGEEPASTGEAQAEAGAAGEKTPGEAPPVVRKLRIVAN